jgi:hypothetical protein
MSLIFNRHALNGLSTSELEKLRSVIRQRLCVDDLSEQDQINLKTSLESIEAVLRTRSCVPPSPRGPVSSWARRCPR